MERDVAIALLRRWGMTKPLSEDDRSWFWGGEDSTGLVIIVPDTNKNSREYVRAVRNEYNASITLVSCLNPKKSTECEITFVPFDILRIMLNGHCLMPSIVTRVEVPREQMAYCPPISPTDPLAILLGLKTGAVQSVQKRLIPSGDGTVTVNVIR